jgi:hypothetical protein
MKIISYNKYSYLKENYEFLNEDSEFNQYQFGVEPHGLGAGYGFASDPQISIYSDDSSPYRDNYSRTSQMANDISRILNSMGGIIAKSMSIDMFIEEIDEYTNFKILRIFVNDKNLIDIYLSFEFQGEEYFAKYKDFNGLNKPPKITSDLFTDIKYRHIDREYYLKLNNYIYKIVYNWFIPDKGFYKNLKKDLNIRSNMGENVFLKEGATIRILGYDIDNDGNPYLVLMYKDEKYTIEKNNFYFFKYWFDAVNDAV